MRVTYIHQHFSSPTGAGGSRPWQLARRLVRDGATVTVVCGAQGSRDYVVDGVRVIEIDAPYSNGMSFSRRIHSFFKFMLGASGKVVRIPADVVFASSTPITVAVPGLVAAFMKRVPLVFEVRDLWPSVPARLGYIKSTVVVRMAQALERTVYRRAAVVIALSPGMREGVLQTWPLADVRVVPNACDFDLFYLSEVNRDLARTALGWSDGPRLAYAGSFGETYRIPWMLRLAAAVPEVGFQIIGEGASTNMARALCVELGLPLEETLPGKLRKADVAIRVASCDVVVSSLSNSSALAPNSLNKVFDAMAAGRPVVFNHDGWLSELLCRRGAGWRLPDDVQEAARRLRSILNEPSRVSAAGEASLSLGREMFDREDLYQEFRGALVDSINGHRQSEIDGIDFREER